MICLDAKKFLNKEKAHDYLKRKLSLPSYYGKNLDALKDVLTEISHPTDIKIKNIHLIKEASEDEKPDYGYLLLQTIKESAEENENIKIYTE